ncbi:MAG: Gfo/Idh/MocA family oxidoreductase [Lentisphaeria bacterium]|nr:Gfo/Idh/MocA family oxidoreductase [Lentisphaeria bacterium]
MSGNVRLALVGCGGISRAHAKGYRDLFERGCREFIVTACCDVVRENAEERAAEIASFQGSEPRVLTRVEDLAAAGCADAADICVPHYAHHTVATCLLDAGLHVMVEKPVGITIRATRAILRAARRNRRLVATAEQVRRGPAARACRWAIRERRLIGDMRTAVVQAVEDAEFDFTRPAFKWRGVRNLVGGGMIMDSGAHFADMVQHLFGEVEDVYCTMRTQRAPLIVDAPVVGTTCVDVEDTWHAVIRFRSGVVVTWTYSRSSPGQALRTALYYGSEGSLRDLGFPFHCFQGGAEAKLADGRVVTSQEMVDEYLATLSAAEREGLFPYGCRLDFGIEVWDFVNAVRTGRAPEMDGEAGLRAKALCEACFESATLGRPVSYRSVLSGRIRTFQAPIDTFWGL